MARGTFAFAALAAGALTGGDSVDDGAGAFTVVAGGVAASVVTVCSAGAGFVTVAAASGTVPGAGGGLGLSQAQATKDTGISNPKLVSRRISRSYAAIYGKKLTMPAV